MNHEIEAHLVAAAGCEGLAGRQMSIGATLVAQSGDPKPAQRPIPTATPRAPAPAGTIDLGPVTLVPWGR